MKFGSMSADVLNRKKRLASSATVKNNKFARGTSLFQILRSFHTILRMIRPQLALPSAMIIVAMMILLLNLHMQNQREVSMMMLQQWLRQIHCHQRHLILLHREIQCHQILIQREQTNIQREITLTILSGLRIRITALSVQSLI